jgi:hypothetical protein
MPDAPDQIVRLDLGIQPEAAISGAVLVQSEHATFLTFNAMRLTNRTSPRGGRELERAGTAVIEFEGCYLTRFGYPDDEARWGIPRYEGLSYGIYEVMNSSWVAEVVQLNRHAFPQTQDETDSRHFLFTFHDDTFECLTREMKVEVCDEPYGAIFDRIKRHIVR